MRKRAAAWACHSGELLGQLRAGNVMWLLPAGGALAVTKETWRASAKAAY